MFKTEGIFSTPISKKENVFNLKKEDIDLISDFTIGYQNGDNGSFLSKDYKILENENFKQIKNIVLNEIKLYEKEVLGFKSNELFLTNSWLSKTNKQGSHPIHHHPNSFIAGVCYLNVPSNNEKIYFHDRSSLFRKFDFYVKEKVSNSYNEDLFWFEVKTGDMIFFPSWLNHSVKTNLDDDFRLVLAFNCFIKGKFGDYIYPNNLEIK